MSQGDVDFSGGQPGASPGHTPASDDPATVDDEETGLRVAAAAGIEVSLQPGEYTGRGRILGARADSVNLAARGVMPFCMWTVGYLGFMYTFFQFVWAFYHVFDLLLPEWLGLSIFFMVMLPSFCIGFACFNLAFARDPVIATFSMVIDAAFIFSLEGLPWHAVLALMSFMYTTKPLIQRLVSKAGSALNIDPARLTFLRWEQRLEPVFPPSADLDRLVTSTSRTRNIDSNAHAAAREEGSDPGVSLMEGP